VMGPDKVIDFCRSRTDVAAVLVCPVRHSGGIEMLTAGLDEDELIAL